MYKAYVYNLCIIYCFAFFYLFKKHYGNYSENYDTNVSFQILRGCHQHIFYTPTGLNLLSKLLVLLYLSNVVGKLLKSQPLMLNKLDLRFPKHARDYSSLKLL